MFKIVKRYFNKNKIERAIQTIAYNKRDAMIGGLEAQVLILNALKVIKSNYNMKKVFIITKELGMTALVNHWVKLANNKKR